VVSPLRIASNPEGQVSSTIQERGRTATRFFPDRRAASNRSNGGYRGQDSAHDPHHEVEEIYPISTYSSSAWRGNGDYVHGAARYVGGSTAADRFFLHWYNQNSAQAP
jgi:hypothetical protein